MSVFPGQEGGFHICCESRGGFVRFRRLFANFALEFAAFATKFFEFLWKTRAF